MPTTSHRRAAIAACLAVTLSLTACADPLRLGNNDDEPDATEQPAPVRLYGTDGTMQNSFAAELTDRTLIAGMKGTRPMPQLTEAFIGRLRKVDPSLQDYLYAAQTYDAVVISALAAELAGTPDPTVVRDHIKGVTTGGEQCRSVAACLELARDGKDLEYRGMSMTRGGFTDQGEPSTSTYETAHFGPDGFIDFHRSEFIGAGDPDQTTTDEPPQPQPQTNLPSWQVEPLRFGGVLPETGALQFAYPPIIAGARVAIADINDAGGVFGVDVEWFDGDSGTDPEVARATIAQHVEDGVHILIGPAASGVAGAVLPDAVAAELIMFSPSNTATDLVQADHEGFYFRTAPPDRLQAAAQADMLLRDGLDDRIVVVARDDAYGVGLQQDMVRTLQEFGLAASAVTLLTYPLPEGDGPIPDLDGVVDRIIEAEPAGLVVIGFEEAAPLLQRLVDRGLPLRR
jgi:ABC-type branched-subunit amino acid transport system substrate-binding protein